MKTLLTTIAATLTLTGAYIQSEQPQLPPVPSVAFSELIEPSLVTTLPQYSSTVERSAIEMARAHRAKLRFQARVAAWSPEPLLVDSIFSYNPRMSIAMATHLAQSLIHSGERHGVDPFLLAALISQESRFNPNVVSPGGAVGLGQILPTTAAELGVNPYDPAQNIEGCAKYLARQLRRWKHRDDAVRLALASYNAGPGAVEKYGTVPPYRITQHYVAVITTRQRALKKRALVLAKNEARAFALQDSKKSSKS